MSDPNRPPVETSGNDAAQGRTGTRTLRVLIISVVLIVVVFAALYAVLGRKTASHPEGGGQSGTDSHAAANAFHTAPASPEPVAPAAETQKPPRS